MPKMQPDEITLLSTEDALRVLAALDPTHGWTFRKLKDRIDRTKEIRPQKVGQTLIFTERQLRRYVALEYRYWPRHRIPERVYGIDQARALLGAWLGRDAGEPETITFPQMRYLLNVKKRIRAHKVGRTLVFTHAELRRFERAERNRRRDKLLGDENEAEV